MDYNQYVTNLYQQELGRAPDPEGLAGWVNALSSGALNPAQVAEGFARSSEGINYDINNAYQSELGRAPDPGGYAGWSQALSSGALDQQGLLNQIRQSNEYSSLAVDQYRDLINQAYEREVGRTSDPNGLSGWATQLRSGAITPEQLPGLIQGSNEGWLYDRYQELFGRGFDPAAAEWTRMLESGQMTRDQVLQALMASEEYAAKNPNSTTQVRVPGQAANTGFSGTVTPFTNYDPMKPLADPRSQPFGFLYDSIQQRLGRDVTPRGLLDVASINSAFSRQPAGTAAVSGPVNWASGAQQQTPATSGASPNVVGGLLDARNLINSLYQQELGRAPDELGLTGWSNAIVNGMTQDQLLSAIRGSSEYQARQAAANQPAPAPVGSGDLYYGGGNSN